MPESFWVDYQRTELNSALNLHSTSCEIPNGYLRAVATGAAENRRLVLEPMKLTKHCAG